MRHVLIQSVPQAILIKLRAEGINFIIVRIREAYRQNNIFHGHLDTLGHLFKNSFVKIELLKGIHKFWCFHFMLLKVAYQL